MPVRSVRKFQSTSGDVTKAGGSSPATAGVGVDTLNLTGRTGANGVFRYSSNGTTLQDAFDGLWGQKTLTTGTALAIATVPLAASGYMSGQIHYFIKVTNGTDFQVASGLVHYAGVNKAGAETLTITHVTGAPVKALSTGTLVPAWTMTMASSVVTILVDPASSLTPTTQQMVFFIVPVVGTPTLS